MPRKICAEPNCFVKIEIDETFCERHRKEKHREFNRYKRDPETKKVYDSARWKKLRKGFLLDHPLCQKCLERGIIVPSAVVDHIVPWRGAEHLTFDRNNLQSLCEGCHNSKTAGETQEKKRKKN